MSWLAGDLTGGFSDRRQVDLQAPENAPELSHAEIARLREAIASQEETMTFLHGRHETLCRVEQGGWWRLRGRLLPVLRLAGRLRALARAHDS